MPQYDEVVEWDYNSDNEDAEPDKQQAPPTTIATVSNKTESKACTIRLDYVDRICLLPF